MTRRCSHCSNNGHNSRTCPDKGVKLFGFRLDSEANNSMRKCVSMGNLSHYAGGAEIEDGYASDGFDKGSNSRERKKGIPWTEDEHKMFLLGLQRLGKGDWRGISRSYVTSRTATQVASHAQKYFNRQNIQNRRRRRSSVFDMVPEEVGDARTFTTCDPEPEAGTSNQVPVLPQHLETKNEAGNSNHIDVQSSSSDIPEPTTNNNPYSTLLYPPYYPPHFPFTYPCYPFFRGADAMPMPMHMPMPMSMSHANSIVKPTAVHCTSSAHVNELVGMSKLVIGEKVDESSSSVPINIVADSKRRSAFHSNNPPTCASPINSNSSPIHAV